jgi:hypothetical protein
MILSDFMEKRTSIQAWCARCRRETLFTPARVNHWKHFFSSLVTCGLWLPIWALHFLGQAMRPLRCRECGWHNPEFRAPFQTTSRAGTEALSDNGATTGPEDAS